MILLFQKLKTKNYKLKTSQGMTYVELIVVLGIFAAISSVVLFNYRIFQAKVDIKNLANDLALKIVQAQKDSTAGKLPGPAKLSLIGSDWKPSYGLYLNRTLDDKSFTYFTDLNNDNLYEDSDCSTECIEKISITRDNTISELQIFYQGNATPEDLTDATISFTRPNSSVIIKSSSALSDNMSYLQITVSSPQGVSAKIKVYASGRIQIN